MSSKRIADELRRQISSGDLKVGDRVPSTRQISREWGVAIATATRALAMLREEGLVRAIPGIGTIVVPVLSREIIVQAALRIADHEGLAAVSMRRVGHELRMATMSLYRYVAGKDELVSLMVSAALAEARLPSVRSMGWRTRVELSARLQWKGYRNHPWLASAMSITRPQLLPGAMAHTEWILHAIDGFGLSSAMALRVALTLIGYVRGVAVNIEAESQAEQETGLSNAAYLAAQETQFRSILDGGQFPMLARISAEPDIGLDLDTLFEFGLVRLVDGIADFLQSTQPTR